MWKPSIEKDIPVYLALVNAIAKAIETGELAVGERLPPQRRLAWDLGINPSTVMQAYREATRRHLVSGEVGRGTYVLEGSREASLFRLKDKRILSEVIDLSTNIPVIDDRNDDISSTLAQLSQEPFTNDCQGYLYPEMQLAGQIAIAEWMLLRNMTYKPNQIKLCAGAQQGLLITLLSLGKMGTPVLTEQFTAPGIKATAKQLNMPLHGIAMDREGIIPNALERLFRTTQSRLVVLTPSLQNPTGSCMSAKRCEKIAELFKHYNAILIEDDVYGALTDEKPLSSYLMEQSVLISSFSKTVAPGLRIGFICSSFNLLNKIDQQDQHATWSVVPLMLRMVKEWIDRGIALKRLQWQQKEILERWRIAKKIFSLDYQLPIHSSPHLWIPLSMSSQKVSLRCQEKGVLIASDDQFSVSPLASSAIRVSLSAATNQVELKIALEKIRSVLMNYH